jgi:Protein kinase domain
MEGTPLNPTEKILGLDPRALLSRRDTAERLRAWLPPEPEEIAPLFAQFEIREIIGRGGMGAVYRARQHSLDRDVAIKLLPAEAAADSAFAERFRNEARALARLQHPNIVAIHESGQTSAGHLFIVMEYVAGHDLAALLAKGPLPAARALGIASTVCAALEFAHMHGVIHRDIKPANVLIADDGTVKVADFGVARLPRDDGDTRLTYTGLAVGTPDYMAPEQRNGGTVDSRADLFSLGVMLYEMLTGELPRGAWQPPSRKAGTGANLDAVVEKAMQPDPAHRPQTAAELRAGIERKAASFPRKHWLPPAAAVLVIASAGAWMLRDKPATPGLAAPVIPKQPGRGEIGPFTSAAATAGRHTPLALLDLNRDVLFGIWAWLDATAGGTLAAAYSENSKLNCVRLPVQPGTRAYEASWELLFEHKGSDCSLVLPAGAARVVLALDLYDVSGLEFIGGKYWNKNATSVQRELPQGRFIPVALKVRPDGANVAITVTLDGAPFIQWQGPQSDLTLPPEFADRTAIREAGSVLLLASAKGGIRVRNFEVTIKE